MSLPLNTKPRVHFVRPELLELMPEYDLISDAIAGETVIKRRGTKYLPMPDSTNKECDNVQRYKDYVTRAVYYNVTRRTLLGLVGQVFMRAPVVELPEGLKPLEKDATGTGIPLVQQAEMTLGAVLAFSRAGVFVDYPKTEMPTTREQIEKGLMRPTIYAYEPREIINWRVQERGAKDILSLVVLWESYPFFDNGFEIKRAEQYRVLKLDESGHYIQEIWRQQEPKEFGEVRSNSINAQKKEFEWVQHEIFKPVDFNGMPFDEIPFTFVGTSNNDSTPDRPNFYDLASLNIAHYRNSADYEEACFIMGQPTLVVSGLTPNWYEETLKGKIKIGSRGGIPLPEGGDAKLLQPAANDMVFAAMEHKERQMVALGAKLVEQQQVQRTATETRLEASADGSILSACTANVQVAYEFALEWAQRFVGNASAFKFEINKDFDISKISAEDQRQAVDNWQKGIMGFQEVRDILKKAGLATMDDELVKQEALQIKEQNIEMQVRQNEASAKMKMAAEGKAPEAKAKPESKMRG